MAIRRSVAGRKYPGTLNVRTRSICTYRRVDVFVPLTLPLLSMISTTGGDDSNVPATTLST